MKVSTLQSAQGGWSILALDDVVSIAGRLGCDPITQKEALSLLYRQIISVWSQVVSGLLLDPDFGLPHVEHKAKKVGVALRLESTQENDPLALPVIPPDWNAEVIASNYGVVKLGLSYHPSEPAAMQKKQFVAEMLDYCEYLKTELVLDLQLITSDQSPQKISEDTITMVQEMRSSAHLMILDAPVDALTAATLTSELDIPWLVRLNQSDYPSAKDTLRQALEAGARGVSIGAAVWSGLPAQPSPDQITAFLQGEGRDRLIEIKRIIDEAG